MFGQLMGRTICKHSLLRQADFANNSGGLHVGQRSKRRHALGVGVEKFRLAAVPSVEHLAVRQTADQARVDQPSVFHARHMAGRTKEELPT